LLRINNISLFQFRNYQENQYQFTRNIVGFCGLNGSGKTNLLDAIYYLCFTKSYFGRADAQNTKYGKQGFRIQGDFLLGDNSLQVTAVFRENGKKEFGVNDEHYNRFADHIGRFPCVMIAPDDMAIIIQGSEERRKFLDYTLSQLDAGYLRTLIDYNKLLQQRNSLLKQYAESGKLDENLLGIISGQLVAAGNSVYFHRSHFLRTFIPLITERYQTICQSEEKLSITYKSNLESIDFNQLLQQNRARDFAMQRTTQGPHRDDLEFNLNGNSFKNSASQGQKKSLLFALKLGEFEAIKQHKGFAPILLLDDVFEKFDGTRMSNLLEKVCVENDSQVFITDTHCDRLSASLSKLDVPFQIIEL